MNAALHQFQRRYRSRGDVLPHGLAEAERAAMQGSDGTTTMSRAHAGRATYISAEQLRGHADPSTEAVARLFEGFAGQ